MQKHVYRPGDKVRIKNHWVSSTYNHEGRMDKYLGTVMTIRCVESPSIYKMKEDVEDNCGLGWSWSTKDFEPYVPQQKIVITSDGRVTKARMFDGKTLLKSAVATCNPEDTFDFETGAKIAFDRLLSESKPVSDSAPQYLTADAICFRDGFAGFTKGRVYHIENGFLIDNEDMMRPLSRGPFVSDAQFRRSGWSSVLKLIDDIEP